MTAARSPEELQETGRRTLSVGAPEQWAAGLKRWHGPGVELAGGCFATQPQQTRTMITWTERGEENEPRPGEGWIKNTSHILSNNSQITLLIHSN